MTVHRFQAHPQTREHEDDVWHDIIAVALAVCVLLVIAFLASVIPSVPR